MLCQQCHCGHGGVRLRGEGNRGHCVLGREGADVKLLLGGPGRGLGAGGGRSIRDHLVFDHRGVGLAVLWLVTQQLRQLGIIREMCLLQRIEEMYLEDDLILENIRRMFVSYLDLVTITVHCFGVRVVSVGGKMFLLGSVSL